VLPLGKQKQHIQVTYQRAPIANTCPLQNLISNNTLLVTFGHSSVQKEEAIVKLRGGGVVRRLFIQQVGHLFKRIKHCEDDECLGRTNVWRVLFDIASAEEAYIVLG